ncbi:MAG: 3'-5' exonuclease, partial [Eubacteriales bacterium]
MNEYLAGKINDISKIEDLLKVNAAKPWQILAITFTNKAANELKERLTVLLGDKAKDIWASTFHSSCARILRKDADLLGYTSHFTIYDTDDSKRTMKECQRLLGIEDKMLSHKTILSEISRAKDMLITPKEYLENAGSDVRLRKIGEAYVCYQRLLKIADAMDFDDIIVNTVKLLNENEDVLKYYHNKFKYILVDEYQDTNHAQYCLTALLAAKHKNICVVGDDDQSIYRFRGATIENILSFEKQYKNTKIIRLERNYRSTQTILDAANAVISNNEQRKGKNLWTQNGNGDKIVLFTAYDEQAEGRYIADSIMLNVASGSSWGEHAILYRMNAQSNSIENAFIRMGVPYRIIGGHRFYERKEVKDAIAYLTVINNPTDNVRLKRIINEPKRGIGDSTLNSAMEIASGLGISLYEVIKSADQYQKLSRAASKLLEFSEMLEKLISAADTLPLNSLFEMAMEISGYKFSLSFDMETYSDRLANINELSTNLMRFSEENENPELNSFLEEVALMTDIDNYNSGTDAVVMMTIHSAKGLEFPSVFLVGLEEGVFPGIQSTYSQSDMEEERRLAYVGITRAKSRLYLTNTRTRLL